MRKLTPLSIVLTAFLCACGGGGGGETVEAGGSVVASLRDNAAPADVCSNGGAQLDTGIDANHNGVLDANEITNTQYVCNGAEGLATLVAITEEPSGGTCSAGGKKVAAGLDANANGILDQAEVASTGYICDGATGAPGVASLIKLTREAPGANCPTGGTKMESGPDSDRDGTLDDAEVTSSSYVCSAPQNASFTWEEARGEVRAQPNTGYIATSDRLVTIVLPESPAFGDVVRVSGVGTGGWRIAQNEGQSIRTPATRVMWKPHSAGYWSAVASSADGTRLVAATHADADDIDMGLSSGRIYTSTDSGASWTERELVGGWRAIASSADGARLVAIKNSLGEIYASADGGASWTARESSRYWKSIASSSDGSRLVAVADEDGVDTDGIGHIYTSNNAGETWTEREVVEEWTAVASSADGTRLVAAEKRGQIYVSKNGGASWEACELPEQQWTSVASSSDGTRLVAVGTTRYSRAQPFVSADGGTTWTPRASLGDWTAVASSADGFRLVAATFQGLLYTSMDQGVTWATHESARTWKSVASSADGTLLMAADDTGSNEGRLFTSAPSNTTTTGSDGGIRGHQYDAIELQYIGKDTFLVLSSNGSLTVQ